MTHRADAYTSEYRDCNGEWQIDVCKFTQAQADSIGAVLEPDGIALDAALRLIDRWNTERKLQGTEGVYSIPFVKHVE